MDRRLRALVAPVGLLALAFVWGTQFLVIQVGQRDLPPLLTACLRFSVLALVAQALALATRAKAPPGHGVERFLLGAAHALSMGLLYWADGRLPSALAGILFCTMPFFVAALAHRFVPGERVTRRVLFGMAVGFVGVALLALGHGHGEHRAFEPIAIAACLGAAAAAAVNRVVSKRLTARLPVWTLLRDAGAVVALATGVASLALEGEADVRFTTESVLAFVYLGLVASALASALYLVLLRRFAVSALTYIQFANAVVAMLAGVVVANERFDAVALSGAVVVIVGLWVIVGTRRID